MAKTNENHETDRQKLIDELTEQLETSITEFMDSEKYKSFLQKMAQFHSYSLNNQLLIAIQKPDATVCASYAGWRAQNRQVRKGEKGSKIICPAPYKVSYLKDKIDPATGQPELLADGTPKKEKAEKTITYFKIGHTFDVSQTEGEPLPEIMHPLDGSLDKQQQKVLDSILSMSPVPVTFEPIPGSANGFYSLAEKRIVVDASLSEQHKLKTLIHEISHAMLHDTSIPDAPKDASTREVQAESIAYVVSSFFGLDTSDYSFGYIAGWSSGKEVKELKSSLEVIRNTSNDIITKAERALSQTSAVIKKETEPVLDAVKRRCL